MVFRELARPMLATWFVYGGVRAFLEPEPRAVRAAPVVEPILKEAGLEDVSTVDLVKVHGAATAAAAAMLALSRTPRTAGLVLTGLAAVTVATATPFWLAKDEVTREAQLEQFLKNISLMGGVAVASTAGKTERQKNRAKAKKEKAKAKALEAKAAAKAEKGRGSKKSAKSPA